MIKKICLWMFVVLMIISIVNAENGGQEEKDWDDMNAEEKWESNPNKFLQGKGVTSFGGDTAGVEYDDVKGTLKNGDITISISDIKGADVTALPGGGFDIKKSGEYNVGEYRFEVGEGKSVRLNDDGSITLEPRSAVKVGDVTIKSTSESVIIHFPEYAEYLIYGRKEPGNHIYVSGDKFLIKGLGQVDVTKNEITNSYESTHYSTIIWTSGINKIKIENPVPFSDEATIARSYHQAEFKKGDGSTEKAKVRFKYTSKEGEISQKMKGLGSLGDISEYDIEIIKTPNQIIEYGSKKTDLVGKDWVADNINVFLTEDASPTPKLTKVPSRELKPGETGLIKASAMGGRAVTTMTMDKEKLNAIATKHGFNSFNEFERSGDSDRKKAVIDEIVKSESLASRTEIHTTFVGTAQQSFRDLGDHVKVTGPDLAAWNGAVKEIGNGYRIELYGNGQLRVWKPETGVWPFKDPARYVYTATLSPDAVKRLVEEVGKPNLEKRYIG